MMSTGSIQERAPFGMRARLVVLALALVGFVADARAADVRQSYELRTGLEMANGYTTFADTRRYRVSRIRRGDESLVFYNLLEGSEVAESAYGALALPMGVYEGSVVDAAYRYDYDTATLHGNEDFVQYFNTFIRPRLSPGAALTDGRFTTTFDLDRLGFRGLRAEKAQLSIDRRFLDHAGARYALLSFEVPAFSYRLPTGEDVIHWASGFAITDEDFGVTYYSGVRHLGVASGTLDMQRPLAVDSYAIATDRNNRPLLDLERFPEGRALAARVRPAGMANRLKPVESQAASALAEDRTFHAAAMAITPLAFSLAENSANQTGTTAATFTKDNRVDQSSKMQILRNIAKTGDTELARFLNGIDNVPAAQEMRRLMSETQAWLDQERPFRERLENAQRTSNQYKVKDGFADISSRLFAAYETGDQELIKAMQQEADNFLQPRFAEQDRLREISDAARRELNAFRANNPPPINNDIMLVQENRIKAEQAAFLDDLPSSSSARFARVLQGLGFLGSVANTADATSKFYTSVYEPDAGFVSVSGATFDEQAQNYLDTIPSRLFWQLADIGISAGTGDIYNAAVSSVGIVSQSVGDVRAAYEGVLDIDFTNASARADRQLLLYRQQRQTWNAIENELDSTETSLEELRRLFNQLDDLDRQQDNLTPLPPPPPELTEEELRAGLAAALDAELPDYPTVTEEQKAEIRRRAEERRRQRDADAADELAADFADIFADGEFLDLLDDVFGDDWADHDILEDSDQFTADDTKRIAADNADAVSDPRYIPLESTDMQDFVDDNAFQYNRMVGTVPTDLSAYADWLATQDIRRVTALALAAGYPNLATALGDWTNLIDKANDQGFRDWAFSAPVGSGLVSVAFSQQQRNMVRAQVALGDLLNESRFVESIGGLSDVLISGRTLGLTLIDFGIEDGDVITLSVQQLGRTLIERSLTLRNAPGESLSTTLGPAVAAVIIRAENEGLFSPNTARVDIGNVVQGSASQNYSLNTGERAVLRVAPSR